MKETLVYRTKRDCLHPQNYKTPKLAMFSTISTGGKEKCLPPCEVVAAGTWGGVELLQGDHRGDHQGVLQGTPWVVVVAVPPSWVSPPLGGEDPSLASSLDQQMEAASLELLAAYNNNNNTFSNTCPH